MEVPKQGVKMSTAIEKKTRQRTPVSDFGRRLSKTIGLADAQRLANKVAVKLGDKDVAKTKTSINSFVRKTGKERGIVSMRSKSLCEAILSALEELEPSASALVAQLRSDIQYAKIATGGRDSSNNWIKKLKAGEQVSLDGPDGHAVYQLVKVGEVVED